MRTAAALVAVNLLWAAQFPALGFAERSLGPGALAFLQVTGGLLVLGISAWFGPRAASTLKRAHLGQLALLGLAGIAVPAFLLPWGLARSTASNAALLTLSVPPFMTVLAWPLLRERPQASCLAALLLGLAGAALASRRDLAGGAFHASLAVGNAGILLATVGNAFYNVHAKRLATTLSPTTILIGSYAAALLPTFLLAAREPIAPWQLGQVPTATLVALLGAGMLPWGAGMWLWLRVLARIDAGKAAVSIYLLPAFGVALAALVLGERPAAGTWAGGALAVLATILATRSPPSSATPSPTGSTS